MMLRLVTTTTAGDKVRENITGGQTRKRCSVMRDKPMHILKDSLEPTSIEQCESENTTASIVH